MSVFRRDSGPKPDNDRGKEPRKGGTPPPRRPQVPLPGGRPFRTLAFWAFVALLSLAAFRMYQGTFMAPQRVEISYTRFIGEVDKGNIGNLQIVEKGVTGELKNESVTRISGHDVPYRMFRTNIVGTGEELPDRVWRTNPGIEIEIRAPGFNWVNILFSWLPLLLLLVFWLLMLRQVQSGGSAALKFGKTKARVMLETQTKVTFKDVAGADEAKSELQEIIEFLKEPQKFQRLGGRIPKGALLLGPPGSGKTLLAKAVAGEAGVPFFSMSGSDFVEMFVGVGASVTPDTPVLIRESGRTRLQPIGEFVDRHYEAEAEGFVVPVRGVQTLGFVEKSSKFEGSPKKFFGGSTWSALQGVYRHRVSEICEIEYLGGVLRTTPDHSVFVRTRNGVKPVAASDLKAGDVLVNLPFRVRGEYSSVRGTPHEVRGHRFDSAPDHLSFEVYERDLRTQERWAYAVDQAGVQSQAAIGAAIGVSQMTVSNWQSGRHEPRAVSSGHEETRLPERVEASADLFRLLGYYTAEGRENGCLEFTFGSHELDLHEDCIERMRRVFGVDPRVRPSDDHSTRITYHVASLGSFFARLCGNGSHEKHVPEALWDLPRECFEAYLTGWALGDGYVTKEGKLHVTSVSKRLIQEMTWLCALHGMKAGVRHVTMPAGRVIKSKPLPETEAWTLVIGKTNHWMVRDRANPQKAPVVRKVTRKPYEGYVYDLCGCDHEAFFGGEKPVLLHNSRVRDLFEQGKRNAPCLTGDTVVTLSGGRQVTIREMFEKKMVNVRVPAMSEDFRLEDARVIGITCKPAPDLFEITTSTSSVKATGNHLFPVLRGDGMQWVPAAELSTGDYVAMPRAVPTGVHFPTIAELLHGHDVAVHFDDDRPGERRGRLDQISATRPQDLRIATRLSLGSGGFASSYVERFPIVIGDDLAYLCGLLASDGYFGDAGERTARFINTEIALHDRVTEILRAAFGYEPRRYLNLKYFDRLLPQGTTAKSLKDCYTTCINNRLIAEALRGLQARILELPKPLIASWLRGVFDGDGCVRLNHSSPQLIYSAWIPAQNQMIRDALLRVGIVTSRSPKARNGFDGNIVITGRESIRAFRREVASDHPRKAHKLDELVGAMAGRETSSSRLDSIPVGAALKRARSSVGMGQRSFERGHVVSTYERGVVARSRTSLQSVVQEIEQWCVRTATHMTEEVEHLRDLADSAILWTRIESIRSLPPNEPVYDLCLERHHSFIANNLVVHNCIIFVDEIDAVGRHRGAGLGGGHDEREQTLNQLLVEMDGFDSNEGVIIIAATNRPDVLDPALLRPGRFDRQIVVDWPDVRGREGILKVHTRKVPLGDDVDLSIIARGTPGLAGADLANMVNEAALLAARRNHKKVSMRDIEDAKDKVTLGMERKSLVMTQEERRSTAYHEAGHALVAWLMPGSDPVDKVTIIPRGRALGLTSYVPAEERHSRSKEDLLRLLAMMMGGRSAEHLIFHHFTTGAANDIERATSLARRMVCELGMSENLGPLTFGKKEEMVFLGKEISSHKDYSEQTAVQIDQEIRTLVEGAYKQAIALLSENLDKLHLLANTLLEREVLDGDEMNRVLRGEKLEPLKPVETDSPAEATSENAAAKKDEPAQLDAFGRPPSPRPAGA